MATACVPIQPCAVGLGQTSYGASNWSAAGRRRKREGTSRDGQSIVERSRASISARLSLTKMGNWLSVTEPL